MKMIIIWPKKPYAQHTFLSLFSQSLYFVSSFFFPFISCICWGDLLKYWIQMRRAGWYPWLVPKSKGILFKISRILKNWLRFVNFLSLSHFIKCFSLLLLLLRTECWISPIVFTVAIELISHFPSYVSTLQSLPKLFFQVYLTKRKLILFRFREVMQIVGWLVPQLLWGILIRIRKLDLFYYLSWWLV